MESILGVPCQREGIYEHMLKSSGMNLCKEWSKKRGYIKGTNGGYKWG